MKRGIIPSGDGGSPIYIAQKAQHSTFPSSSSSIFLLTLCNSCVILTLIVALVFSMTVFSTRENGIDLLNTFVSSQLPCKPLTNESIEMDRSRAQFNKSENGNITILTGDAMVLTNASLMLDNSSAKTKKLEKAKITAPGPHEEAKELLGGWYIPPDLDVMAQERKHVVVKDGACKLGDKEGDCGRGGASALNKDVTQFCGPWMRKYAEFHRQARTRSTKKKGERVRYITYICHGNGTKCTTGMGDDLVGIVSSFMVALVSNRVLLIDWDPDLNREFEPAGVDWRVNPELAPGWEGNPGVKTERVAMYRRGRRWQRVKEEVEMSNRTGKWLPVKVEHAQKSSEGKRGTAKTEEGKGRDKPWVIQDVNNINPRVGSRENSVRFAEELWGDVDHLVVRWNRGIVTRTLLADNGEVAKKLTSEWGMRPPIAFGCILRLLFRVKPEVLEEVAPLMRTLQGGKSICIHARVDDRASGFYINKEIEMTKNATNALMQNGKTLFDCAEALSDFWFAPSPSFKWLVMSSSLAFKEEAKRIYGDKVVTSSIHPRHVASQSLTLQSYRALVAEWALLTTCDKFILTESGFSKTAVMYSLKPQSTWLYARWGHFGNTVCSVERPTNVKSLGMSWSGL